MRLPHLTLFLRTTCFFFTPSCLKYFPRVAAVILTSGKRRWSITALSDRGIPTWSRKVLSSMSQFSIYWVIFFLPWTFFARDFSLRLVDIFPAVYLQNNPSLAFSNILLTSPMLNPLTLEHYFMVKKGFEKGDGLAVRNIKILTNFSLWGIDKFFDRRLSRLLAISNKRLNEMIKKNILMIKFELNFLN